MQQAAASAALAHNYSVFCATYGVIDLGGRYKLIIFDLGGVLINYNEYEYYAYLSSKTNIAPEKISHAFKSLLPRLESGKITMRSFEAMAAKAVGLPKTKLEWSYAFKRLASKNVKVEQLIKRLRKMYKVVLLTNNNRSRYEIAARGYFNPKIFDRTFLSFMMGMCKPHANIYRQVLKEMHAEPEETIFIDNMEENVSGARRLGIHGIVFTNYKQLVREMKKIGVM